MVRAFVRLNYSTGGVMTLTDKTKCKFRLEITLQPMRADAYSVFIINAFVLNTVLKDFYFKYMLLKV